LGVCSLPTRSKESQKKKDAPNLHPDVNFVFVERSVVLDSITGTVYLQSLIPGDGDWIAETASLLKRTTAGQSVTSSLLKRQKPICPSPQVIIPNKSLYKSRINRAKEHLFDGDSYELCLTAQTLVRVSKSTPASHSNVNSSSWERYKNLRASNPAPYSAYLRLHPSTLLSSSPERFLSFSRPPGTICQLRPIKGTIRKSPGITRTIAERALVNSTKEVAENLMIVDLIRHDLHGVLGEDVQVKQFCRVEEYETVWQPVSVVEGKLSKSDPHIDNGELGWEVLRRSLPPGM
jgi:para-aminobenzoate synthetase